MQASSKRSRFSRGGTPHRVSSSSPASRGFAAGGAHSHEGDVGSINAWVRVYEDDALAAADRADAWLATGEAPALCGIPSGSRTSMRLRGSRSRRPVACSTRCPGVRARRGPVSRPLGWCCSATCTRTSSLRAGRRPGGQSLGPRPLGRRLEWRLGSSARSAHGPRRNGHGHGRFSAHPIGPSAGHLDDQANPRNGADSRDRAARPDLRPCRADGAEPRGLRTAARRAGGWEPATAARAGPAHRASRPRLGLVDLDADVADGFETALGACRSLGLEVVDVPAPDVSLELGLTFLDLVCAEMLVYHRRFDDRRGLYRPSIRGFIDYGEHRALSAESYVAAQGQRAEATWSVGRLVRRAPSRRADRADRADRRAASRARLRRGVHRRRRDLAHALLELDGPAGRRAAFGCRRPQRPAGRRLADRGAWIRLGSPLATGVSLQASLGIAGLGG